MFDHFPTIAESDKSRPGNLELGAFSISLNVKDLRQSRLFYENLGFEATGGAPDQGYLIMVNGEAVIGLFQGMFEGNILTFNPGLTNRMERIESFADVRQIQSEMARRGVAIDGEIDTSSGPASLTLTDPDGNSILIDQFF